MCTYMIQVAEGYNERAIFRCEHGTFHLAWDRGLFYLSAEELTYLQLLFSKVTINHKAHSIHGNIQFFHRAALNGDIYFELWIEEAGLKLSIEDCEVLKGLLHDALDWQKSQPPFTKQKHIQMVKALSNVSFQPTINKKPYWN